MIDPESVAETAEARELPLADLHREAGARMAVMHGVAVPRHYGDPTGEYRAAEGEGAVVDRSNRALLPVEGRAPARMLTGIVSGRMPPELVPLGPVETTGGYGDRAGGPTDANRSGTGRAVRAASDVRGDGASGVGAIGSGVRAGAAPYSAILTPKGKLVTDLRLVRLGEGEAGGLLLDVPLAGVEGLLEHLKTYMPPRFAKVTEPAEPLGLLTVTGKAAAHLLSREVFGLRLGVEELEALAEGEERAVDDGSSFGLRVIRTGEVLPPAFDLLATVSTLRTLWKRFLELGLAAAGSSVWETLRIEKGRPRYGAELDRDTLPPEAGIDVRAIDHQKGCYTGQEVIVRVRDRGRVNRHLRGFLLGDRPTPAPGTPLFIDGRDRAAGEIRSAAESPRFRQVIALGYLRREAEPPTTARLGAPDGPEVGVRALSDEGWIAAGD